jgi:hypothetical protein
LLRFFMASYGDCCALPLVSQLACSTITFRDCRGNEHVFLPGQNIRLPVDGAYDVSVSSGTAFTPIWRRALVSGAMRQAPTKLMMNARIAHVNRACVRNPNRDALTRYLFTTPEPTGLHLSSSTHLSD